MFWFLFLPSSLHFYFVLIVVVLDIVCCQYCCCCWLFYLFCSSLIRFELIVVNKDFIAFFSFFLFWASFLPLFNLLRLFIYSCTLQFISFPFAMLCCPILMILTKKPVCDFLFCSFWQTFFFFKYISCCSIS